MTDHMVQILIADLSKILSNSNNNKRTNIFHLSEILSQVSIGSPNQSISVFLFQIKACFLMYRCS